MTAIARERVHAMESLAGIIAHELRAGVLGVTSAAQLLRFSLPADPMVERSLGRILQEAERLSAIHEALTEYATELPPVLKPADPDAVWISVLRSMRGTIEANGMRATHVGAPGGARVRLDDHQLTRAFERAVLHAMSHAHAGAELDIVSTMENGWWSSALSSRGAATASRSESGRPTLMMVLCQRSIIAHGGEVLDAPAGDGAALMNIRLPLSLHAE